MSMMTAMLDWIAPSPVEVAVKAARRGGWSPDAPGAYCARCGASTGPGAACAFCVNESIPWRSFTRLGAYHKPMAGWIAAMKFHRRWHWARWAGERLADAAADLPAGDDVIVCSTPMHWLRRWRRGYNQAALMAEAMAARRRLPHYDVLRRVRYTPPQTLVPPHERTRNVAGSIEPRAMDLTGLTVWLVDDVKTSGATLRQCCKALRAAGAVEIHAMTAAVGHPLGHDFSRV